MALSTRRFDPSAPVRRSVMLAETIPIPGFSDPVSSISHLVGLVVFGFLGPILIRKGRGNRARVACLVTLYVSTEFLLAMSMTYHLLTPGTFARDQVLGRLDHAAIFVLIAGTLTTAHGITFFGWQRWVYITLVWIFAAIAIPIKIIFFREIPELLSLAIYLGFGWVGLVSGVLLYRRYGLRFIAPVLLGGIAYSVGAVAEYVRSPQLISGVFGHHEFFHIMVLVGLGLHWWFIWEIADYSHPAFPGRKFQYPSRSFANRGPQ